MLDRSDWLRLQLGGAVRWCNPIACILDNVANHKGGLRARTFRWGNLLAWLLILGSDAALANDRYVYQYGPHRPNPPYPNDEAACMAAWRDLYPTREAACQASIATHPACDRNNASFRSHVAWVDSAQQCNLKFEYLDHGTTIWKSWTLVQPVYVCPANHRPRPAPLYGCSPVREEYLVQVPQDPQAKVCASNPIYPLTGAKKEFIATGIVVGGLELTLNYDTTKKVESSQPGIASILQEPPSLGALWRTNFHRKLLVLAANKGALLSRGDGDVISFDGASGSFVAAGSLAHRLVAVAGGYHFSDAATGAIEVYDGAGKLVSIANVQGKVLTFAYRGDGQLALSGTPTTGRFDSSTPMA